MNKFNDDRGFIETNINQGVGRVVFGHPSHNALPTKLLRDLATVLNELSNNEEVKVIVLSSNGDRTFCAGASFDELVAIQNEDEGKEFFSGFAYVINAIRLNNKLVVGQAQGKAIGGGVGLLAACDYCFATANASIRLSELKLNIGPFVIASAVERKIGLANFTDLALNPDEWKDPHWSKERGLYQEVLADKAEMENAVNLFCEKMVSYAPNALMALKRVFWTGTDHWDTLLFERATISGRMIVAEETKQVLKGLK